MADAKPKEQPPETSQFLAAIIASSDDAIISKDLNGTITSWNPAAERIFGYSAEEMVGQSILRLIPCERRGEEEHILGLLKRGQRVDHFETVRLRKDGGLVDVSVTISPVRDVEGELVGASKIARDISAQKRAERDLLAVQKQLEVYAQTLEMKVQERTASLQELVEELEGFSYSMSHDLRAPLRSMQGFARVLLEDHSEKLDALGKGFLERIANASARLDGLIRDVLTYSNVARADLRLESVDLQILLPDIISHYINFQEPQAEVEVRNPLSPVIANEAGLTQCLTNLLSNGVKFVAPGKKPKVRVWTEPRGETVRIWVEDNGIGIEPEHRDRIFGMFERLHSAELYEGTGIGLSIVRKAMVRMGGTFGLESTPNEGSKFWLELRAGSAVPSMPRSAPDSAWRAEK